MFLYEERNRHHPAGKAAPPPDGERLAVGAGGTFISGPAAGRLGVDRELFARMLKTASASLLLGILVFLLTPRVQPRGVARGEGVFAVPWVLTIKSAWARWFRARSCKTRRKSLRFVSTVKMKIRVHRRRTASIPSTAISIRAGPS